MCFAGDGYFDNGLQKQYNKNPDAKAKSTIRIRLGINLNIRDKELLDYLVLKLGIGKIDYSKTKSQYRLLISKTDIVKIIYPYLKNNKVQFLTYNRRRQFFLLSYILDNQIIH